MDSFGDGERSFLTFCVYFISSLNNRFGFHATNVEFLMSKKHLTNS